MVHGFTRGSDPDSFIEVLIAVYSRRTQVEVDQVPAFFLPRNRTWNSNREIPPPIKTYINSTKSLQNGHFDDESDVSYRPL